MRNEEQTSEVWNECSWNKFNVNGREHWYNNEDYNYDYSELYPFVLNYGTIENINLKNCCGIEDWEDIVNEYN